MTQHIGGRAVAAHGGKRADLGGLYVRSAWEANIARYFTWLQDLGQIAGWAYEPCEFTFPVKRGVTFYRPDFSVTELSTALTYYEVKGWMDTPSRVKLARMARYYPDVRLVLIDGPAYRAIATQVSRAIPGWE